MKIKFFLLIILAYTFIFSSVGLAAAEKWDVDKAHSNVYFDIKHTFVTVRGQFEEFSATVRFDPQNMPMSSVSFNVSTKSVNTGITKRDNHLRSEEFFEVNNFPSMTFQSTGLKQTEGNQYTLEGKLSIKGITKEVAVLLTYLGTRENPFKPGQMVAGFEARFSIDRLDYQVGTGKFLEMGVIGNKVDILVALEVLK